MSMAVGQQRQNPSSAAVGLTDFQQLVITRAMTSVILLFKQCVCSRTQSRRILSLGSGLEVAPSAGMIVVDAIAMMGPGSSRVDVKSTYGHHRIVN